MPLIESLVGFTCNTLYSSGLLLTANPNREKAGKDSAAVGAEHPFDERRHRACLPRPVKKEVTNMSGKEKNSSS